MASFLEKQGYRALALRGGYMTWYKAGYPIERKEATAALPLDMACPECGQPAETHQDQFDKYAQQTANKPVGH